MLDELEEGGLDQAAPRIIIAPTPEEEDMKEKLRATWRALAFCAIALFPLFLLYA